MTTKDEQAEHGKPKREPMLSASKAESILREHNMDYRFSHRLVTSLISGFYENLITTNKLRVVEEVSGEVKGNFEGSWLHCSGCNEVWSTNTYSYCPGCGQPIKKS